MGIEVIPDGAILSTVTTLGGILDYMAFQTMFLGIHFIENDWNDIDILSGRSNRMNDGKQYSLYTWWAPDSSKAVAKMYFYIYEHEEEKKMEMTKEEALKKIEELKAYVEQCEEKEEEIPEMPRHGNYNVRIVVPDKPRHPYIIWDKSFEHEESSNLYNILSFELAQLIYAREYLKVDGEKLLRARKHGDMVFKVIFDVTECVYVTINVFCSQTIDENERIWCFKDERDANRVRDYMNKYVRDVKKNMY